MPPRDLSSGAFGKFFKVVVSTGKEWYPPGREVTDNEATPATPNPTKDTGLQDTGGAGTRWPHRTTSGPACPHSLSHGTTRDKRGGVSGPGRDNGHRRVVRVSALRRARPRGRLRCAAAWAAADGFPLWGECKSSTWLAARPPGSGWR